MCQFIVRIPEGYRAEDFRRDGLLYIPEELGGFAPSTPDEVKQFEQLILEAMMRPIEVSDAGQP